MKKIKYLFGFLLVGIGLLFNNYIFAFGSASRSDVFIDGVTLPLIGNNFQSSASYLYTFTEYAFCDGSYCSSNFSYSTLKDGVSSQYFHIGQIQDCDSTTTINNTPFNNSALSYEPYNGYFRDIFGNGHCNGYFGNMIPYGGTFPIKVSIGVGPEFGKAFVYTNDLINSDGVYSPHYGLGNGFFSTENYGTYNTDSSNSNLNYFRFFYKQNANLSSPLDGFNLSTLSGTNITGFIAWQYFNGTTVQYQTQYNTNRLYIGDYGSQFLAGTHFGGYGMGYSSALDTLGTSFIRWSDFSFQSVGSIGLESAMQLGTTSYDFLKDNKVINLGILVLKGDSYVTRNNNASVVLLSKNPNNVKQILYEQYDCAYDDLSFIFNTEYCNSISHGYIKHDGSDEVLPFTGYNDVYVVGDGNGFLDLLLGDGTFGYVSMTNNQYCLNSSSKQYCFTLTARPNDTSLKELYLQGSLGSLPTITNVQDITEQMLLNCKGPYYNTPDGLPPAYCNSIGTDFTGNFYTSIGTDGNGNIIFSIIQQNPDNTLSLSDTTFVIDENGNYVATCSGDCNGTYIYYGSLDQSFTSTGYFNDFFNKTGRFFQCPYSYDEKVVIGKKLVKWLGGYDVFLPINCFIASFQAGKNAILFGSGLHLIDGGPLFKSDSSMALMLYHFFDFLLSIGIILFSMHIGKVLSK